MADDKAEDATPESAEETLRKAKVGVKDKHADVHTAMDQPVSGIIADLADGDD